MRILKPVLIAAALIPVVVAAKPHPVRWEARTSRVANRAATVNLRATIERGWYVYGLSQTIQGPRPLRFRLTQSGATIGAISAPRAKTEYDQGFRGVVAKYTSAASFVLPIRFTDAVPRSVNIEVRYQACNGTVCLPPRTQIVTARLIS